MTWSGRIGNNAIVGFVRALLCATVARFRATGARFCAAGTRFGATGASVAATGARGARFAASSSAVPAWLRVQHECRARYVPVAALLVAFVLTGCKDSGPPDFGDLTDVRLSSEDCLVPLRQLFVSTPRDGIPVLNDPALIPATASEANYIRENDLVLSIHVRGDPVAVPHAILRWHEIVQFDTADPPLAVTYCPLTGSGIVFDRRSIDGLEFGNLGLIFLSNMVMYDRRGAQESVFSQMARQAICGPARGQALDVIPVIEMRWDAWKRLYPAGKVVSSQTGFARDYRVNPYSRHEQIDNFDAPFPVPFDPRRLPKERVLGIPDMSGGIALPFLALEGGDSVRVVHPAAADTVVVLFDAKKSATMAYSLLPEGSPRSFEVREDRILDVETQSVWDVTGRAVEGPRAGE